MSDTPRTAALRKLLNGGGCKPDCDSISHTEDCPYANGELVALTEFEKLERELGEANKQRAALDKLATAFASAASKFIDKCDHGKARSVETYYDLKTVLSTFDKLKEQTK